MRQSKNTFSGSGPLASGVFSRSLHPLVVQMKSTHCRGWALKHAYNWFHCLKKVFFSSTIHYAKKMKTLKWWETSSFLFISKKMKTKLPHVGILQHRHGILPTHFLLLQRRKISTVLPNLGISTLWWYLHSNGDRIIKGLARAICSSGL